MLGLMSPLGLVPDLLVTFEGVVAVVKEPVSGDKASMESGAGAMVPK